MDIDIQFLYTQFINLNRDAQFIYVWLAAFFIFIIWQISTNPISQISNAVSRGNINLVRKCLEKGADVDLQSGNGVTLLYLASNKNHREIAELLISYSANVNQGLNEEYGCNPLLVAVIGKYSELVEVLIANGAKVGLHVAALQGTVDIVETFLEQQKFPVNSIREGMTPLCLAAIGGHLKIAQLLLDRGATLDFLHYQRTPLYQAAKFNHLELVDLLIDRGSNPNYARTLHIATCRNHQEIVKRLIARGVNVNYQDDGGTPLLYAAHQGNLLMVDLLIRNGANVNSASISLLPSTPLDHARSNGHIEVMQLLKSHGAIQYGFLD